MKALSFAAGAVTILVACLAGEGIAATRKLAYPTAVRVALGAGVALVGAGLTIALGGFTIISHMCG